METINKYIEIREGIKYSKKKSIIKRFSQFNTLMFIYAIKNDLNLYLEKSRLRKNRYNSLCNIFNFKELNENDIIEEGYKLLNDFKRIKLNNNEEIYLKPQNPTYLKRDSINFYLIKKLNINENYYKINLKILKSKYYPSIIINMEKYILDNFNINYNDFLINLNDYIQNQINKNNFINNNLDINIKDFKYFNLIKGINDLKNIKQYKINFTIELNLNKNDFIKLLENNLFNNN